MMSSKWPLCLSKTHKIKELFDSRNLVLFSLLELIGFYGSFNEDIKETLGILIQN